METSWDPYVCHINGVPFTINIPPVMLAFFYHTYGSYGDLMGYSWDIIRGWRIPHIDFFVMPSLGPSTNTEETRATHCPQGDGWSKLFNRLSKGNVESVFLPANRV